MDERYPVGATASCVVHVLRHGDAGDGYGSWSATIGLLGGEATLRLPGHYAGVLAERLGGGAVRAWQAARAGRISRRDRARDRRCRDDRAFVHRALARAGDARGSAPRGGGARDAALRGAATDRDASPGTRPRAGFAPGGAV